MTVLECKICGMKINNKNYNFNSNAFLNFNSEYSILHCPFCGVSNEYFIDSDREVKEELELDIDTTSILDKAMKLETFNGDFYSEASRIASSEKLKNMFNDLSKIEYAHAKIHMTLGGFKEKPVLNKLDYSSYNDLMLIERAKKREEHAISFYKKNYNKVCSDIIREVFRCLTKVEEEHIELTAL